MSKSSSSLKDKGSSILVASMSRHRLETVTDFPRDERVIFRIWSLVIELNLAKSYCAVSS